MSYSWALHRRALSSASFRFADDSHLSRIGRWFPSADAWSRQAQLGLFAATSAAVVCRCDDDQLRVGDFFLYSGGFSSLVSQAGEFLSAVL